MRKLFLSILISVGVIAAAAAIYPYLNVGMNNDLEVSYPSAGLTLKFADGKLVATNNGIETGTQNLSDLLYMAFGLGKEVEPDTTTISCDVNRDGSVNAADVTALYGYILSGVETYLATSDVNEDGSINAADVTMVYSVILNGETTPSGSGTVVEVGEITEGNQTMWVVTGDVSWAFTTEQLDTIVCTETTITALGKTFNYANIDSIYVDSTLVADNTVDVAYDGSTAKVIVAGNIAKNMTASVNGAHVVALQDVDVADEITYSLAGNSNNGSFYQDGSFKATVQLNGLTLHNPDSAAINIRDGKRIAVELVEGTTNTLTDGEGGSQKGCFAVKGHTEFKGAGILNITGNSSHAFWGKEYVEVKKTVGEINIMGAKGDGFNINQYYLQNGGKVTIKNVGDDGIQVSQETDDEEDEENTGEVTLKNGTIDMTMTSAGGKGIKAATNFIMLEGTFKIVQSGNLVAGDGDIDYGTCVKTGGDIIVHGGTIDFANTAQGGKGLNADGTITIDEANTTTDITIKANGQGGTAEAGSSSGGGETPQSYKVYVAKPSAGGGPGGGSNAWSNMYLYKSDGTLVANITGNTVQKSSGYSTLTFYYYDFGGAASGTYYFKSDNYTSGGGWGGGTTYAIRSVEFSAPTQDTYYQIVSQGYNTEGNTRIYNMNNVTSTYGGGTSDQSEENGTGYNAAGIKADGNITISGGTVTVTNSGAMSKSIKSKATVTIDGGTVDLTASGAMMVINSDASYSHGVKCQDYVQNGGDVTIKSSGIAGKGISSNNNITTNGGSLNVTATGAGQYVGSNRYTTKGLKADNNVLLNAGTITVATTQNGAKAIRAHNNYTQGTSDGNGPTVVLSTQGARLTNGSSSGGGMGGKTTGQGGAAKGIKAGYSESTSTWGGGTYYGTVTINGGQIEVTTQKDGGEGIEGKAGVYINGGNIYAKCYDDAIGSGGPVQFNGGVAVAYSFGNDAVDSNYGRSGAIQIGNGCVLAYSSKGGAEEGFDCDNNSYITITGNGYAIGAGGSQGGGGGWGGGSSGIGSAVQGYYLSTSSLSYSTGRYYTIANSSGTNLITYSMEASLSSSLSLFTAKGMTKGQSYTVKYSTTAPTNATTAWHGVYLGSSHQGSSSFTSFTAQ